jgi:hypothetical protein
MKTLQLLIVFISLTISAQSQKQTQTSSGATQITSASTPAEAKKLAKSDIENLAISLFIQGGFAPIVDKADYAFEKKYSLKLRDFGCTALNQKIISAYNTEVFKYLQSKYGDQWREEIRKDVIGLKEYTKKK